MIKCYTCKEETEDFELSENGNEVCNDCINDNCERCLERPMEVEVRNSYWCSDCYSGAIDDAYEYYQDR